MFLSIPSVLRNFRPSAAVLAGLVTVGNLAHAAGFSTKPAPTVTAEKAATMEVRYFTELLGTHSQAGIDRQFGPIVGTEVTTVVCAPMGWRFYNFPSEVDRTWRDPDKFPRDEGSFPNWRKMVDNLAAGGDPLREALATTRKMGKRFVASFRMNDSHYVYNENWPTHNNFWRAHPEYRLGNEKSKSPVSGTTAIFNYSHAEVRDFYYAVLEELCTKYDLDGVELDLQRAPRYFPDADVDRGRAVMTAHIGRIREMLDRVGTKRGRPLTLDVRVLPTIAENQAIGLDVLAWDAAGWLNGIVVSSYYIHTADTGIEEFSEGTRTARVYGELNYVHFQAAGTGHNANERRYLTPETYRAASLSYLERGADGVSFFNTYCIPPAPLGKLMQDLLGKFRNLAVLQRSDKNYTTYANKGTIFGKIFPAKDESDYQVFIADKMPGIFGKALLRLETRAPSLELRVEAWVNGTKAVELDARAPELFPPLAVNDASPKRNKLKFFAVPISALKFGANRVLVKNLDRATQSCDFVSSELGLYLAK